MGNNKKIIDYYENCEEDYRIFWDLERSMAMHAGYWDHKTRTLPEALMRENEVLAEIAQIKEGDRVLDAGCGVGGSSIYLAKRHKCRVTGISLSEYQVQKAIENAKKAEVEVDFQVMDFTKTTYPDESFDIVWGLESVCHADDKKAFIKEAYRLLKKGGRLIVADGFSNHKDYTDKQKRQMGIWLKGWGVDFLETAEIFHQYLKETAFDEVHFRDITHHVIPSSRKLYWVSFPGYVYSKIGELFGFRTPIQTENIKGAYYQYVTIRKNLWKYGIFSAKKLHSRG